MVLSSTTAAPANPLPLLPPPPPSPLPSSPTQEANREADDAKAQAALVQDLEEKNKELRQLNDHLENQVTKLCESPFISEAFQKHER